MKSTANIATMPGREIQLEQTIKSIYSQFDVIRVVCNEMADVPNCLKLPKIQPIMGQTNYTDNGKFYSLDKIKANEYYFTLDDDIIYPPDYVDKTIDFINLFGCIVSYHGRILKGENLNYYRGHLFFHCNDEKKQSYKLDVCGTGVTAFRTDYFKPTNILNSKYKCMSDIVFSLEAAKQNKTIGLMTSSKYWIKPQMVIESIYRSEVNGSQTNQIKLSNEIYRIKN